jgi:periplasmic protein TonB
MAEAKKNLLLPIIVGVVLLAAGAYFVMGLMGPGDEGNTAGQSSDSARTAGTQAQQTSASQSDDLEKVLEEARAANQKGQLVAPEGANAVELYLRALELDPENRIARDALIEIMPYATDRTDQYIKEGNIPQAERALALLRKADPTSPYLVSLSGNIDALRRRETTRAAEALAAQQAEQERIAQQVSEAQRAQPAPTPAPEPSVTEATVAAAPTPSPAAQTPRPTPRPAATPATTTTTAATPAATPAAADRNFQLVKKVDAIYPLRAQRQRIEGWVEMTFTIDTSGNVKNVAVVNAQPKRQFDREAMRALSQYKFRPRIEGGKAVESQARQRLEFRLQ